jgi:hypothetical protein
MAHGICKPCPIGGSEALFAFTVEHSHTVTIGGGSSKIFDGSCRAVRTVVVDHDHVRFRELVQSLADHLDHIVDLVVGRDDDDDTSTLEEA